MRDSCLNILCWSWWRHGLLICAIAGLMLGVECICSKNVINYLGLKSDALRLYAISKKLQSSQSKMLALKLDVERLDAELDLKIKQLDLNDLPLFTHKTNTLAAQHALTVKGWRTLNTKHYSTHDSSLLELYVQGHYTEFVLFLQELLLLPQVLSVDDVKIERIRDAHDLKLYVILKIYQPHYSAPPAHAKNWLNLDFLGVLKAGAHVWGIVCVPGGRVMQVKVGDLVGDKAVTQINADALWMGADQHFLLHTAHNGCHDLFGGSVI